MDQDGAAVRYLTGGEVSVVSPRYSPVSQDIAYMAQRTGEQPRVHVLNIETGTRQIVRQLFRHDGEPRASRRTASPSRSRCCRRQRQPLPR